MRVVSTKVKMVDSFSESEYFNIINKWLTEAGPCKAVAEQLEAWKRSIARRTLPV